MKNKNAAVRNIDIEITTGHLEKDGFSPAIVELLAKIADLVEDDPLKAIEECKPAIALYPNISEFYGYLVDAYHNTEDDNNDELANKLTEDMYARFPNDLMAKCYYALWKMEEEELDVVPVIFNNTYNLKDLCPERQKFHISEFELYTYTMGEYFVMRGELDKANVHLAMLKAISPNHFLTQSLMQNMVMANLFNDLKEYGKNQRDGQEG